MPSNIATSRPTKVKSAAKRRRLPVGLSGATLLARAKSGEFGRGIDWAAVSVAYASRRKRSRAT
jgi:hypothetical protein